MMSSNSGGRPEPREPRATEPRPVEPRVEARVPATPASRPPEVKAEPRPAERGPADRGPAERGPADRGPADIRAPDARAHESPSRASVLGPSLRFRGELSAQEDLIVQGSVEGSITHTQCLTIGSDGSMKGDIRARNIVVDGKVDGDLYATESVSVRATARVKGNVFAPRVAITEGAFFQGQVEMQPSGAAVQEHSARMRQAALSAAPLEGAVVDRMLGGT